MWSKEEEFGERRLVILLRHALSLFYFLLPLLGNPNLWNPESGILNPDYGFRVLLSKYVQHNALKGAVSLKICSLQRLLQFSPLLFLSLHSFMFFSFPIRCFAFHYVISYWKLSI